MRILVMGDFSARGSRGAENHADLASRAPIAVDADDFERKRVQPCAETNTNDRAGQALLERGLIPP
jgi:predicted component of type VI protein secretion system